MSDEALIEELALSLDMFLTHHVERDTLACDLTNDELTLMATGIADIIRRREIEAGEKVKGAAAYRAAATNANCYGDPTDVYETIIDAIRDLDVAAIIGGEHD